MSQRYSLNNLPFKFPTSDRWFYFKTIFRERGLKAVYKQFNSGIRRPWSRSILKEYANTGIGLELGVGAKTIAPVKRTILSDAFEVHGVSDCIAQMYFPSDNIPFPDNTFSFILSEHMLEHLANPIKTLQEFYRVLKPGGRLILFLPHKERTFDKLRERTKLEHLIQDYESETEDNDRTHLDDFKTNVIQQGLLPEHYLHLNDDELIKSGSIHHHVWIAEDISELLAYLKWDIKLSIEMVPDRNDSFAVVAQKK